MFSLSRIMPFSHYPTVSVGTANDILKYIESTPRIEDSYEYTITMWENGDVVSEYVTDSIDEAKSYLTQYASQPC